MFQYFNYTLLFFLLMNNLIKFLLIKLSIVLFFYNLSRYNLFDINNYFFIIKLNNFGGDH
ncbi:MAG: hypothetical protein PWP28_2267 [Oceanotoga sp.]|jgi:hypothetical protein|nr:hypothetical protein [Oceanotoga sp.]